MSSLVTYTGPDCNRFLGEISYLLGVHDVHDNATLQHLGETGLDSEVIAGGSVRSSHYELCKRREYEQK